MLETVIGVILLITYLAFIVYAAKGGNLMLGLFVMAVLWSGLGFLGGAIDWPTINSTIFDGGPTGFGSTAVYIIFGSWFGRVLIDTGIAGTIIRKAVELGGDKPGLTCILLCIVTAAIFTTSYGPGAVVAIGVIVFPIMLSLGIPKPLACGSFVMSVGCGLYFNQSLLTQAAGSMVIGEEQYQIGPDWYQFAAVAFVIHFVSIVLMVILTSKGGKKKAHAWAASAGADASTKNVGLLGCLTVLLPVTLSIALGINQVPAICLSVLWALIFTGNLKSWNKIAELVQKTFHDGFRYFAQFLGVPLLASIEEEEGSEASAKEINEITALVKEYNLSVIFTEVNGSDATAQAISRETGCAVAQLTMLMDGPDGGTLSDDYCGGLMENIRAIVNGFAGEEVLA